MRDLTLGPRRVPRLFEFDEERRPSLAVLHDRLELRLNLRVQFAGSEDCFRLNGEWKRCRQNPRAVTTIVPIADADGVIFSEASLAVDFRERQPGVFETGRGARLRLNGNRILRGLLGLEGLGPSLDGNTNWVGDCEELTAESILLHHDGIGRAIDLCRAHLLSALPAGSVIVAAEAMLVAAEASHDCRVADAAQIVASACLSAMAGTRATEEEVYSRGRASAPGAVARYILKGGAILKIYAKASNLVRVEVSCPDRKSIAGAVGERTSAELDANSVVLRLLDPWMDSAFPLVRAGVDHIRELERGHARSIDLVDALAFMADFERGEPLSGGYKPRETAQLGVRRARRELLDLGKTSAKEHRPGTQVRRILDEGVERGVLKRDRGSSVYRLAQRFALPALRLNRTIEIVEFADFATSQA